MRKNRIVVVTDCRDVAANEIRATLITELESLNASERVEVEPIVEAKEFSVINGAFLVRLLAEVYNPKTTIFLVVLNPLQTDRPDRVRIAGQTKNGFRFVGENTGTLGWLIKDFGISKIYETVREGLDGKSFISFGGKVFHAPTTAKVASGFPLKRLGLPFPANRITYPSLEKGMIVHIDNFGVAKIFKQAPKLTEGTKIKVLINGKRKVEAVFTISMKNLPDRTWAIYPGSSLNNLLEFGLVRDNAARELSLAIGDTIEIVA